MSALALPLHLLEFLGRRAPIALWVSLALGMAFPGLSEFVRPLLGPLVFVLLSLAFLRVEPAPVRARLRRPLPVLTGTLWLLLVIPALATATLMALPDGSVTPDIALIVFLACAGPPVMSAPGFIAMMGLDGAFALTLLVCAMALTPITAPVFADLMTGGALHLAPLDLALRLAAYLLGSLVLARLARAALGAERIRAGRSKIDGLNVVLLFLFALAAMDGVAASFLDRPLLTLAITVMTFVVAALQLAVTYGLFRHLGAADAFALAHSTGSRNMGLMVAALGSHIPELVWLWFALGQLPIYMLPLLLKPIARRLPAG